MSAADPRIHDYLDGRMSDEERRRFEDRLAAEPDLARRVADYRRLGGLLRENAPEDAPSPGFATRVRAAADSGRAATRSWRWLSWEAAGGAVAVVLLLAFFVPDLLRHSGPPTLDETRVVRQRAIDRPAAGPAAAPMAEPPPAAAVPSPAPPADRPRARGTEGTEGTADELAGAVGRAEADAPSKSALSGAVSAFRAMPTGFAVVGLEPPLAAGEVRVVDDPARVAAVLAASAGSAAWPGGPPERLVVVAAATGSLRCRSARLRREGDGWLVTLGSADGGGDAVCAVPLFDAETPVRVEVEAADR